MRFIKDLHEGENIIEHYLCKQKQILKSRSGKSYISLKLQDKTGVVDGKVWDINNNIQSFEENDFIKVDATALSYQSEIQLNIKKIRRSNEGEYDPIDYIPSTKKDSNEMYNKLKSYIDTISNNYIKTLLENIVLKNSDINLNLKTHSAAKSFHHGYMGGLVEHTLSVVEICDFMSSRYDNINRDILVACAILHDIGKIFELSPFPLNDYTDDGQMLGHIYICAEIIGKEADKITGFPKQLESLMKHCILSHHGEYEFGSPKRPKTIEAFILHCADDMDAKTKIYEDVLNENSTAGNWAGYNRPLARNIRSSNFD